MNNLQDILALLGSPKNCLILPHIMPDGDTIGSCLALSRFLIDGGHAATIVLDDTLPADIQTFVHEPILSAEAFKALGKAIDLVFCVDFSDLERLGTARLDLLQLGTTINLDHHKTNTYYADYNVVDLEASATGEVIYALIKASGSPVLPHYAEPLFVAISTDTGSFKYSNTTARTHMIVSELYEAGIAADEINRTLYQNTPFHKLLLHAEAMNHLERYKNGQYTIVYVSNTMLERCSATIHDTDGLVESIRDIHGVELVVFLKEIDERQIKISLRSKRRVDVSELAQKFGGGGHKHAAGFTLEMPLHEALGAMRTIVEDLP